MEDLAPQIVRHRLLIEGFYAIDIDRTVNDLFQMTRAIHEVL